MTFDIAALIEARALTMHFQPIVAMKDGSILGHEALARPTTGPWPNADALFTAARQEGLSIELELTCLRAALVAWSRQRPSGKLFINLSATALVEVLQQQDAASLVEVVRSRGVPPSALVIEITEHEHVREVERLQPAVLALRRQGVAFALDDFGDGRSSLRLWSELKPEMVKIDKYFTRDVASHGDKLQTMRALIHIAETFGSSLVAEGIESDEDLRVVRDLGIGYGQGYGLGRPQARLVQAPLPAALAVLGSHEVAVLPQQRRAANHGGLTAAKLCLPLPPASAAITHDEVFARFQADPALHAIAVVEDERPLALLNRQQFIHAYAQPFFRELYARRPAQLHGNPDALQVDIHTGIHELTSVLTSSDQRYLTEGFIVTENGRYRGLGTGEQLVRAVTEARIEAARHANPLTFLPGNIPISDHIDRLIDSGCEFAAGYADLNHFKPFNDQYGYWRGDEMIRLVAAVIVAHADPQRDFVGHVGGDDFIVVFQSTDWRARCEAIVAEFNLRVRDLFDAQALAAGGLQAEDRHGVMRFHPCTTLCIGVVPIKPGDYRRSDGVANAAAAAKRLAKHGGCGVHVLQAVPVHTATA
ncbi:phosphodiesterase [Aquincola tertiaricarbonis]|uniref:phosphodiesterase n=1 Tax=Aquincola tertiaricarbonis TaxID=391953 RepID=UPI000614FA23|nr:phosphodiesterase [Aquincola tertiaricarbonis]